MRLVIQRVNSSSVTVKGEVVGEIDKGLLVLFGAGEGDTKEVVEKLANKLMKLRIMADENGKMNLSIKDTNASVLVVSQFTLYADTTSGNRPSFIKAANPELANTLYNYFVELLRKHDITVQTGRFGSYMKIVSVLDGPVTIVLEE